MLKVGYNHSSSVLVDLYQSVSNRNTAISSGRFAGSLSVLQTSPLTNLIESDSLKGNSKKWAIKIETLHTYVPSSTRIEKSNDPMWE